MNKIQKLTKDSPLAVLKNIQNEKGNEEYNDAILKNHGVSRI